MAEEPTLPRMPAVSWDAGTQTFANTKKRARNLLNPPPPLFNNSSDPAVFSSDDDPHVDNYTHGRHKKKRYVGSWFQQQLDSSDSGFGDEARNSAKAGKRTLERQIDSGVWMGSDDSVDMDLDGSVLEFAQPEPRLPQLRRAAVPPRISESEELVKERIETAIEQGVEDIDLSALGLENVPNSTIARLSEVSYIPFVTEGVPFEQKDPSLRLYLANNPLRKAPGAVFNLEFLTLLSLRNTKISELPPSIGTLRNLQTLNLSLNRLRYLPAELLDLLTYPSKLVDLTIHPNPFHRPSEHSHNELGHGRWEIDGSEASLLQVIDCGSESTRVWLSQQAHADDFGRSQLAVPPNPEVIGWHTSLSGRSPVQYCDSRGVVTSSFRLPAANVGQEAGKLSPIVVAMEDLTNEQEQQVPSWKGSRVHSLLEVALRACSRTMQIHELPSYLPRDAPAHLAPLLQQIVAQGEDNDGLGDLPCSICKQRVIVPMTRWIEWWSLSMIETNQLLIREQQLAFDQEEKAVPFLRQGCSWGCRPGPAQVGSGFPNTLRWECRAREEWM
ncbi:hypothetical protein Micbo1qcDRAFT_42003 [Microdochium bolleyi]|uniref:Uncharacterized protein n=1 Tax=Microdochium bolleyi TaxID=196109 RepID=A0A136JAK6_9PEZI|nr:hypothetical protein Micbo1qcDRAFT_42003 [Microdochium bolleyi]